MGQSGTVHAEDRLDGDGRGRPEGFDGKLSGPRRCRYLPRCRGFAFPSAGEYRIAVLRVEPFASTDLMYLYAHDFCSNGIYHGPHESSPRISDRPRPDRQSERLIDKDGRRVGCPQRPLEPDAQVRSHVHRRE